VSLCGIRQCEFGRYTAAEPSVANDNTIYPTTVERERLFVQTERTREQARAITRLWQKFKTGQQEDS
jgi:hypothetical protein